jgi:hypothetical protein
LESETSLVFKVSSRTARSIQQNPVSISTPPPTHTHSLLVMSVIDAHQSCEGHLLFGS